MIGSAILYDVPALRIRCTVQLRKRMDAALHLTRDGLCLWVYDKAKYFLRELQPAPLRSRASQLLDMAKGLLIPVTELPGVKQFELLPGRKQTRDEACIRLVWFLNSRLWLRLTARFGKFCWRRWCHVAGSTNYANRAVATPTTHLHQPPAFSLDTLLPGPVRSAPCCTQPLHFAARRVLDKSIMILQSDVSAFAAEATVRSPTPPSILRSFSSSCRSLPLSSQAPSRCHQIASPSRVAERPSSTSLPTSRTEPRQPRKQESSLPIADGTNNFKAAPCDLSVFLALLGTRS
ncbi:hypothetical protein N431DRAFT_80073 [Stipitochalara longipes BDJ]|nr:hypothetical protein N431DRAFT_80073 [Stipitochalara longipes BDJ]